MNREPYLIFSCFFIAVTRAEKFIRSFGAFGLPYLQINNGVAPGRGDGLAHPCSPGRVIVACVSPHELRPT